MRVWLAWRSSPFGSTHLSSRTFVWQWPLSQPCSQLLIGSLHHGSLCCPGLTGSRTLACKPRTVWGERVMGSCHLPFVCNLLLFWNRRQIGYVSKKKKTNQKQKIMKTTGKLEKEERSVNFSFLRCLLICTCLCVCCFCALLLKALIPKLPFRPWGEGEALGCSPTGVWPCLWLAVRFKQTTCLFDAFPLSVSKMEGTQTSLLAYAHIWRWQEKL